jgi:glycosyltransferase involved in cell wall biosynthesis
MLTKMSKYRPRLLFIVNTSHFFISHRLPLAVAASEAGFDVHVGAPGPDKEEVRVITNAGCSFHPLTFERANGGIIAEVYAWFRIAFLIARARPNILHAVSIKPVIYGGVAAKLLGVGGVVFSITGLRYRSNCKAEPAFSKRILAWLTKVALSHKNSRVIFQNGHDLEEFVREGLCSPESAVLIPGSGVDIGSEYTRRMPPSETQPVILLAARMVEGKGVREYVAAARAINTPVPRARFLLAGRVDRDESGAVPIEEIMRWAQAGWIEWLGLRSDVPALLAEADIACLPSHGGEGVPRFLLEALAASKAIVTTDVPGCRDLVVNDLNGKLVQPASASSLQTALSELIGDAQQTARMGEMSPKMLSARHELRSVVRRHLDLYTTLLSTDDANRLRRHLLYSSLTVFPAKAPIQTTSQDSAQ